jgi:hypothetical protein
MISHTYEQRIFYTSSSLTIYTTLCKKSIIKTPFAQELQQLGKFYNHPMKN